METISVQTSHDGYQGAPASPTFYRTDWQGTSLLYPTSRTNYAPRSQDFNLWTANTGLAVTPDTSTAPDGTLTADTLSATGGLIGYGSIIMTVASGTALRIKCWVKNIDSAQSFIYVRTAADAGRVAIFWSGPAITTLGVSVGATNAQFISYPNGWYLVSFDVTTNEINQTLRIYPDAFTTNKSIYAWGYQALSSDGTYIKTDATAVTITDYTLSNGVITLAQVPITGATLSYDNSVLPSPYYIFATGDGVRTQFAYDGVWGTLSANSGKGNVIWQIDLRGAQSYQLVKSAGAETATVNMTLKRDALQYTNSAGTWSVT